jgi:deazaflavin-dependent oxidoreductase (nitroreductase family)
VVTGLWVPGTACPAWRLVACPATSSISNYNQRIIDEFRANRGRPPSWSGSSPLLLLHHRGAKSGVERVNPVAYLNDDGRYVIFASKAGAPTNPAWYQNLKAHPETTIEVGSETLEVVAGEAHGDERERLFATQCQRAPQFAEYQQKTDRVIPVIALTPRNHRKQSRARPPLQRSRARDAGSR